MTRMVYRHAPLKERLYIQDVYAHQVINHAEQDNKHQEILVNLRVYWPMALLYQEQHYIVVVRVIARILKPVMMTHTHIIQTLAQIME